MNIMGNTFMDNNLDCAFECAENLLKKAESNIIIADFHIGLFVFLSNLPQKAVCKDTKIICFLPLVILIVEVPETKRRFVMCKTPFQHH